MTKSATGRAAAGSGRGRAPYASHACNLCRRKKTKCDGVQPVCGSCVVSGRPDECSWTIGEPVRVPRTEAHFEALRKRVEILQEQVKTLQGLVDQCNIQHGGVHDYHAPHKVPSAPSQREAGVRPDAEAATKVSSGDLDVQDVPSALLVDYQQKTEKDTHAAALAMEKLKLEENGNLVVYGTGAPFSYDTSSTSQENSPAPSNGAQEVWVDPLGTYTFTHEHESQLPDESIDWDRHLPVASVPLSQEEHDLIMDYTFKFFTCYCLRVVPSLFLRDMYQALATPITSPAPSTSHYSPMLHNILVAIGTSYSDDPIVRDSGYVFAAAAQQRIEDEALKPNLAAVQGLSLLGSYHSSRGRHNLGFLYFGMSIRMSQILGLQHDVTDWVNAGYIKHEDMLNRNWMQWSLFSMDINWSQYVGRDPSVKMPTTPPLCPFPAGVGGDMTEHAAERERFTPHPGDVCRSFPATCQLSVIVRNIVTNINALAMSTPADQLKSDDFVSRIDLQLNSWRENLHPDLTITLATKSASTPQKIMLHLLYWTSFMLLHKPFVRPRKHLIYSADKEIDHYKLCKRAADHVMELMVTWRSKWSVRLFPMTLSMSIFSAGTIYLMEAEHALLGSRVSKTALKGALGQASLCLEYLQEASRSWPSCLKVHSILEMLYHRQLRPVMDKRVINIDDIPIGTSSGVSSSRKKRASPEGSPESYPPQLTNSPSTLSSSSGGGSYHGAHAYMMPPEKINGSMNGIMSRHDHSPSMPDDPYPTHSGPMHIGHSQQLHSSQVASSSSAQYDSRYLENWDATQSSFGPLVSADALLSGQTIFGNAPGLMDDHHHRKHDPEATQAGMHVEEMPKVMGTGADWITEEQERQQRQQQQYAAQQVYGNGNSSVSPPHRNHVHSGTASPAPPGMSYDPNLFTQMWRQRGPTTWRG